MPSRATAAQFADMSTLTKPKKAARRVSAARVATAPKAYSFTPRTPPASKATAADLLKIKNFGEGLDGELVESIVADRARL